MARALLTPADLPQLPRLKINQLLSRDPTSVTSTSVTLTDSDWMVMVDDDTAGGTVTVTLPAVADSKGNIYHIKKLGTTASVIIDGNGSETIDGATTQTITTQYVSIQVYCDGSEWFII
jgi:hypothetical protein